MHDHHPVQKLVVRECLAVFHATGPVVDRLLQEKGLWRGIDGAQSRQLKRGLLGPYMLAWYPLSWHKGQPLKNRLLTRPSNALAT